MNRGSHRSSCAYESSPSQQWVVGTQQTNPYVNLKFLHRSACVGINQPLFER